jgi:hypothetical protein
MKQFGNRVRTKADRLRDATMFLATARPHMILRATAGELAARYGVPVAEVEGPLAEAQNRVRWERVG